MTTLHEQARAEAEKQWPGSTYSEDRAQWRAGFVDGAEWAATRTRAVTTPAELDALPVGSVVLDAHDNPWARPRDGLASWVDLFANSDTLLWWSCTRIDLPARVLYEPEETP